MTLSSAAPRIPGSRSIVGSAVLAIALLAALLGSSGARAALPALTILSPANDAVIGNGTSVVVSFVVSDFTLVQPGRVGEVSSPTEGHLDVFVDGAYVQLVFRVEPIALSLDSGRHAITLQLKESNGIPLSPDVIATVSVTVTRGPAGGAPGIAILAPTPGDATGHDVYVAVKATNFAIVAPQGQPNAPNEGHLVIRVEGSYYTELSEYAPAFLVDLADGTNTITVILVNNDGTPLTPNVNATTYVYIKPSTSVYVLETINGGVIVLMLLVLAIVIRRRWKGPKRP